ncbi:MAG TPA: DUF1801 domain-containing protein [Chitinophagaceae bacterium]
MVELKTKQNDASVEKFLKAVKEEQQRKDALVILELFKKATGEEPKMWGSSIVGFGTYHYKYASGREGDWFVTGFSPRKQNMTLYLCCGFEPYGDLLKKLGKFKTGKGCLYFKKLEDIDLSILKEMIKGHKKILAKYIK